MPHASRTLCKESFLVLSDGEIDCTNARVKKEIVEYLGWQIALVRRLSSSVYPQDLFMCWLSLGAMIRFL